MFDIPCALCKQQITKERQEKNRGGIISTAHMVSERVFEYGLSGNYEFKRTDLGLKEGDYVCIDCMEANEFEPSKTIECARCHVMYQPSMGTVKDEHGRQYGWGCCGHVEKTNKDVWQIGCGFGSRHDMTSFPFVGEKTLPEHATVCDDCIDAMVKAGEVTEDNSFWENLGKDRKPLDPEVVAALEESLKDLEKQIEESPYEAEHLDIPEGSTAVPIGIPDPMNPVPRKRKPGR